MKVLFPTSYLNKYEILFMLLRYLQDIFAKHCAGRHNPGLWSLIVMLIRALSGEWNSIERSNWRWCCFFVVTEPGLDRWIMKCASQNSIENPIFIFKADHMAHMVIHKSWAKRTEIKKFTQYQNPTLQIPFDTNRLVRGGNFVEKYSKDITENYHLTSMGTRFAEVRMQKIWGSFIFPGVLKTVGIEPV